jgi:3-isopropylmalate/(R)-2-methylmalate dehydratase small subunit
MKKFTSIRSKAIPLGLNDVDTDQIIPAQYLTGITREGLGRHLFKRLREGDPGFVFNRPEFSGAEVLIANANFGCGSSREHAVWALADAGIKAVIAKSFADIFTSNAAKNGLLLVQLEERAVDELRARAENGSLTLEVNLEKCEVSAAGDPALPFQYDPFRRHCLLNGLDDLDYLLSHRAAIDAHRKARESARFFSTLAANR